MAGEESVGSHVREGPAGMFRAAACECRQLRGHASMERCMEAVRGVRRMAFSTRVRRPWCPALHTPCKGADQRQVAQEGALLQPGEGDVCQLGGARGGEQHVGAAVEGGAEGGVGAGVGFGGTTFASDICNVTGRQ